MRICVVHVMSLIIVLIPIILNVYFLLKNYKENLDINGSLTGEEYKERSYVESRVRQRVSRHAEDLDSISSTLSEINHVLSDHPRIPECSSETLIISTSAGYFGSAESIGSQLDSCNTSRYINYADEALGAQIQKRSESPIQSFLSSILGFDRSSNPPANVLRSSMDPGSCYAFKNKKAELQIKLAREVWIEFIEMEHILKSRSPSKDVSNAPKNFKVFGIDTHTGEEIHLGDFEFSNTRTCQLFSVQVNRNFQIIKLRFENNHGHPENTCVYRIAVYGQV